MTEQAASASYKRWIPWLIYMSLAAGGLCIDIYTPSLPDIQQHFHTGAEMAKLTITIYMLGLGLGQPLAGPFTDRFGRRWILTGGLLVSALIMLITSFTSHITSMFIMRFLQGLSISCALVPARAMINDLFEGSAFKKIASTTTIVWALGPVIAPYIGGYIQHYFSWQGNFYALAIYLLLTGVIALFTLQESLKQPSSLNLKHVLCNYTQIARHSHFIIGTALQSLSYAQLTIFGVIGSFLIQAGLHHNAIVFGRCGLLVGLGWLIGNVLNRLLININEQIKLWLAVTIGSVSAIILLAFAITHYFNLYSLILPIIGMSFAGSLIFPIAFSNTLALFPEHAAKTNALMVGLVMFTSGIITAISSEFHQLNLYPISISYAVIWGLSALCSHAIQSRQRQQLS